MGLKPLVLGESEACGGMRQGTRGHRVLTLGAKAAARGCCMDVKRPCRSTCQGSHASQRVWTHPFCPRCRTLVRRATPTLLYSNRWPTDEHRLRCSHSHVA